LSDLSPSGQKIDLSCLTAILSARDAVAMAGPRGPEEDTELEIIIPKMNIE